MVNVFNIFVSTDKQKRAKKKSKRINIVKEYGDLS